MDLALVLILHVIFQPALSVLFTVEAEQSMYKSEFGQNVVMGCRFKPKLSDPHDDVKVTWNRSPSTSSQYVFWMENGKEHFESQNPNFQGRVKLLTEDLKDGWAKLQISRLRISDSGVYQCLVQTAEGADYQSITLSVKASYKPVTKHIQKVAGEDEVLLTCQSEGYPESSVTWKNGNMQEINPDTTAVQTTALLFNVTSQIRVPSSDKNNYTCSFTSDGYSATFHIPDEVPAPPEKNVTLIIILVFGLILGVVGVLIYRRKKGLKTNQPNEEERVVLNEGGKDENLEAFVKARYSDTAFGAEVRQHLEAVSVEELSHRLLNNKGQPVNLQALLPEAGETLFLEGPPGSGKTTVAHIMVSSWTAGNKQANLLDLSTLQLLLYVDCSRVKGDLFQEIKTQLSITENMSSEEKLSIVLTRSSNALLLLDGYREGNQCFDVSLRRFLKERGGCRVLVMACPGHCDALKETVGTVQLLELQTQTVKY